MKFVLIQMLLLLAFVQVLVTLPLDMRAHGLGIGQIGWLLGLNGVFIVLGQPIALRALRRFGHVQWLVAGAVLTALGLGMNAFAGRGRLVYVLAAALWTAGEIGVSSSAPALVADFAPADSAGRLSGDVSARLGRGHDRGADGRLAGARPARRPGALARLPRRLSRRRGAAPQEHRPAALLIAP